MSITAICPGSFDPITNGHLDIIKRACGMFDRVIVLVLPNASKQANFTVEERLDFIRRSVKELPNVEVDFYDGLLAQYAEKSKATVIVKGLRAVSDFEYEFQMALTNKKLNPKVDTVFIPANDKNMYLSSSIVRQVASMGGSVSGFVPADIENEIFSKLNNGN